MLVLEGNIPRFPWEPSTTTLTYRLNGTTEDSVSYRVGRPILTASATSVLRARDGGERHTQSSLAPAST